jgi:hypothetical protein
MKYVSEILEKLSTGQRILGLLMLLCTIVLLYLGPKMMDTVSISERGYNERLTKMETRIFSLEEEVALKSELLRKEKMGCTETIIRRENEFLALLDGLQNNIENRIAYKNESKRYVSYPMIAPKRIPMDTIGDDEDYKVYAPSPQIIVEPPVDTSTEDDILSQIIDIKQKIRKN